MMAGPAVMYAATTALTFVVAIAAMATINWQLTLIALLPLPPITLTARYSGRTIHERFERIQAQLSDLSAVTQEALAGVRVVRAYRQEARELERFRAANLEYVGSQPCADPACRDCSIRAWGCSWAAPSCSCCGSAAATSLPAG